MLRIFRKRASAPVARERLQVLLSHERSLAGQTDLITVLREDILAAIGKHITIDPEKVDITMNRADPVSILKIDIEIAARTEALAKTGT